jgi:hypothetical protein
MFIQRLGRALEEDKNQTQHGDEIEKPNCKPANTNRLELEVDGARGGSVALFLFIRGADSVTSLAGHVPASLGSSFRGIYVQLKAD